MSSCLKVQPLSCAVTTPAQTKASKSNSSSKSSKSKSLKTEKPQRVPSIAIHHHPYGSADPCPPHLLTSLTEAPPMDYFHASVPTTHGLAPLSPGMVHTLPPTMVPSHSQHSASVQGYQLQSPKMAQLSPGSAAFPANQASSANHPPAPPTMYTSDPSSPMQVTYSPSQPLIPMTSSADMYGHAHDDLMSTNNGHNVVSVAFTAAGQTANVGLHHPHFLPPPNYTEAIELNNGMAPHSQTFDQLAPGYDPVVTSCAIGGEYHGVSLPTAGMLGLTGNHF